MGDCIDMDIRSLPLNIDGTLTEKHNPSDAINLKGRAKQIPSMNKSESHGHLKNCYDFASELEAANSYHRA